MHLAQASLPDSRTLRKGITWRTQFRLYTGT